jgi:hypothetical protein
MIGTRRSGKTTKMLEHFLKYKGNCLFLCANNQRKRDLVRQFRETFSNEFTNYSLNNSRFVVNGEKTFMTIDYFQSLHCRPKYYKYPKFIDDFECIMRDQFGPIACASASGPLYTGLNNVDKNPFCGHEDFIEWVKDLPEDVVMNEFTSEWGDDD